MKRTILLLALALAGAHIIHAQDLEPAYDERGLSVRDMTRRNLANRSYINLGYVTQATIHENVTILGTVDIESDPSDWGAAFSIGRDFVLHRKPVGGMVFFGLNANWFDANYAVYETKINTGIGILDDLIDGLDSEVQQLDLSVGIGPSVHVIPVSKLGIHTYCRYQPGYGAYAGRVDGEYMYVQGSVVHSIVAGGAVSWGAISLGAEARWGTGDYKLLSDDKDFLSMEGKMHTAGMRAYLSLRF